MYCNFHSPHSDSTGSGHDSLCGDIIEPNDTMPAPLAISNHHQEVSPTATDSESRDLKDCSLMNNKHDTRSGHARTHKIVINLDDKERFTEEVIV